MRMLQPTALDAIKREELGGVRHQQDCLLRLAAHAAAPALRNRLSLG